MARITYHLVGGAEFEVGSDFKAANDTNTVIQQLRGTEPIQVSIRGGSAVLQPGQVTYVEVRD